VTELDPTPEEEVEDLLRANPKLDEDDVPPHLLRFYYIFKGKQAAAKEKKAASLSSPAKENAKKRKVKGKGRAEEAQKKPQHRTRSGSDYNSEEEMTEDINSDSDSPQPLRDSIPRPAKPASKPAPKANSKKRTVVEDDDNYVEVHAQPEKKKGKETESDAVYLHHKLITVDQGWRWIEDHVSSNTRSETQREREAREKLCGLPQIKKLVNAYRAAHPELPHLEKFLTLLEDLDATEQIKPLKLIEVEEMQFGTEKGMRKAIRKMYTVEVAEENAYMKFYFRGEVYERMRQQANREFENNYSIESFSCILKEEATRFNKGKEKKKNR